MNQRIAKKIHRKFTDAMCEASRNDTEFCGDTTGYSVMQFHKARSIWIRYNARKPDDSPVKSVRAASL